MERDSQLENLVAERTASLEASLRELANNHSRLLQTEKLASIGQLAAGVAHEINNPVGYIKSNLNVMKDYGNDLTRLLTAYLRLKEMVRNDAEPDKGMARLLDDIAGIRADIDLGYILEDCPNVIEESLEGIERVIGIVSDLKNFAHLDGDEFEAADINSGLESTLNIAWNELKYKAKVVREFHSLPEVWCYPQRLNQVFMNILVNAAQAIEDKGTIRISTRPAEDHVEVEISDNGRGIAPEVLDRIFDPFFTTKQVGKGTGLGLSVAYNIIKNHQGSIEVDSEPRKGTTFIIRIPINAEKGDSDQTACGGDRDET
jgi:signal transduction histidine kinase